VAAYLTQFLSDKRVITLPWPLRQLLVRGVIVPFRTWRSAAKYRRIWTDAGSPLLLNAHKQQQGLAQRLPHMRVLTAMRYGEPSVAQAVAGLMQAPPSLLLAVPMFPHYSAATTATGVEALTRCMARHAFMPSLRVVEPLSALEVFHQSLGQKLRRHVQSFGPEHLLFSFHGLPLAHIEAACGTGCRGGCKGGYGGGRGGEYNPITNPANPAPRCYLHQCHATAKALAAYVPGLPYSVAFQSRMRGSKWAGPSTLETAKALAQKGVTRLLAACPSFVCDCLETLEEVDMGIREVFLRRGGKAFECMPCLNDEPAWLDGLAQRLLAEESPSRAKLS